MAEPALRRADGPPVEDDAAGIGLDQLHQQPRRRRLAAAGFADDAERLARSHSEGDVVDRLHGRLGPVQQAAPEREMLGQVLDCQQRAGFAALPGCAGLSGRCPNIPRTSIRGTTLLSGLRR